MAMSVVFIVVSVLFTVSLHTCVCSVSRSYRWLQNRNQSASTKVFLFIKEILFIFFVFHNTYTVCVYVLILNGVFAFFWLEKKTCILIDVLFNGRLCRKFKIIIILQQYIKESTRTLLDLTVFLPRRDWQSPATSADLTCTMYAELVPRWKHGRQPWEAAGTFQSRVRKVPGD